VTRLLLVLGGARSGKSAYAEQRVETVAGDDVLYLATLCPGEPDLARRIAEHRQRRPAGWAVRELLGADGLEGLSAEAARRAVLLDGVELWLAALDPPGEAEASRLARMAAAACAEVASELVCVVSSEVGMGVVPATDAGVRFRDNIGAANAALAAMADEVTLVVAGLALAVRP
jgi:adenosylcobinamide kinase/adenosylcobinamide-phosphate guanylyltransferase